MSLEIKLNRKGKLKGLEGVSGRVKYHGDGDIKSVNGKKIEYHRDGTIKRVGNTRVKYYGDGDIKSIQGDDVKVTIE